MWSSVLSSNGFPISARRWNRDWPTRAKRRAEAIPSSLRERASRLQPGVRRPRAPPVQSRPSLQKPSLHQPSLQKPSLQQPSLKERPQRPIAQAPTPGPPVKPATSLGGGRRTRPTICSTRRRRSCAGPRLLSKAPRKRPSLNEQRGRNEQRLLSEHPNLNEPRSLNERRNPAERIEEPIPPRPRPPIARPPPASRRGRRRQTKPTICSTRRRKSCAGWRLLARAPQKQLRKQPRRLNERPGQLRPNELRLNERPEAPCLQMPPPALHRRMPPPGRTQMRRPTRQRHRMPRWRGLSCGLRPCPASKAMWIRRTGLTMAAGIGRTTRSSIAP